MDDETRPLLNESASAPSAPFQMPPLYDSAWSLGARSTYGEPGTALNCCGLLATIHLGDSNLAIQVQLHSFLNW